MELDGCAGRVGRRWQVVALAYASRRVQSFRDTIRRSLGPLMRIAHLVLESDNVLTRP
jgi:hypothetical protein